MTVWNLGSINVDRFYDVPHLPAPGETVSALAYADGLGGKGANMSVAVARGATRVCHIGAVGSDGIWARDRLLEYGVDTRHVAVVDGATGHANILIDEQGENQITICPGANHRVGRKQISDALTEAATGDILLFQNETNGQAEAAHLARQMGLQVAYAAAPFSVEVTLALLDQIDLLFLNAVEAEQLSQATGKTLSGMGIAHVIVTRGAEGATWFDRVRSETHHIPAHKAVAVDTTGAGDTFTGFALAGLDRGLGMAQSLDLASQAAALMVARKGTADVIPDLKDIEGARFGR